MKKDVRHFFKYDYDIINYSLDWTEKLTRTPSVCNQTNTKSLVFFASSCICAYALKLELNADIIQRQGIRRTSLYSDAQYLNIMYPATSNGDL